MVSDSRLDRPSQACLVPILSPPLPPLLLPRRSPPMCHGPPSQSLDQFRTPRHTKIVIPLTKIVGGLIITSSMPLTFMQLNRSVVYRLTIHGPNSALHPGLITCFAVHSVNREISLSYARNSIIICLIKP